MKSLVRLIAFFVLSTFIISCKSEAKKKEEVIQKQSEFDSIALIYDPQNVDPRVDEFMQKLHKRSGFNGNVLIAKKGKIIYQNSFGWAD